MAEIDSWVGFYIVFVIGFLMLHVKYLRKCDRVRLTVFREFDKIDKFFEVKTYRLEGEIVDVENQSFEFRDWVYRKEKEIDEH